LKPLAISFATNIKYFNHWEKIILSIYDYQDLLKRIQWEARQKLFRKTINTLKPTQSVLNPIFEAGNPWLV